MSKRISLPVSKSVEDLLLWRDSKTSGAVFGGATAVYLLFGWSGYSFLSLVCNALLTCVLTCVLWSAGAQFMGRTGPPVPHIFKSGFTEEEFKVVAERARVTINAALAALHGLACGQNVTLSLKVMAGLWVAARVGALLSLLDLAYMALAAVFVLPKAYESRKDDVDRFVSLASRKAAELMASGKASFERIILKKGGAGGSAVPANGAAAKATKKSQ